MSNEQPNGDIVTIDGKQFSRLMAEEMAKDIELASELLPNVWAILSNSALMIGNIAFLSFALPLKHGYVMDSAGAKPDVLEMIKPYSPVAPYAKQPSFLRIWKLPPHDLAHLLDVLRPFHESAIRAKVEEYHSLAQSWQKHDFALAETLSKVIDRPLPEPGFSQKLKELRSKQLVAPPPSFDQNPGDYSSILSLIQDRFAASGLHYTDALLATFYTALQTKGFVVLSGISGTGKAKIATGFVEMLPVLAASVTTQQDREGLMPIVVKPYMKKERRMVIPSRYYELLIPMDRGQSYRLPVSINGTKGTGRLWFRLLGNNDQYLLSFDQILGDEISQWAEGRPIYLEMLPNPEGDRVAEVRITSEPPMKETTEPIIPESTNAASNHLFLSVRPDWRDSTSLLGYYNPLTQTYEWTEFLRFILRTQESYRANDGLAWFVILDEMNLAHVEYYFADLLSILESGRDAQGWTREPLRLTYPDSLDDDVPPREIHLPPNLYLIGTVNMDETTHAFSPKVLDRAFTIELTDVDFANYQIAPLAGQTALDDAAKQTLLDAFTRLDPATGARRFARIDKAEIAAIVEAQPDIRNHLDALNRLLQRDRFHFGYRVFDEIAQYLFNNDQNQMMPFATAFDWAVFMKVLPKFTGSRARLRGPLLSVLAWTLSPSTPDAALPIARERLAKLDFDASDPCATLAAGAEFPAVAARTARMLLTLEIDGFVSFG